MKKYGMRMLVLLACLAAMLFVMPAVEARAEDFRDQDDIRALVEDSVENGRVDASFFGETIVITEDTELDMKGLFLAINECEMTIPEGVTLTLLNAQSLDMNESVLNVDGTMIVNHVTWINTGSTLNVNGTLENYSMMHVGYANAKDGITGPTGVLNINGTFDCYRYVNIMTPNNPDGVPTNGGIVNVNGTLNIHKDPNNYHGFVDVGHIMNVASTAVVTSQAQPYNGGIMVNPFGELNIAEGADVSGIDEANVGATYADGGYPKINGWPVDETFAVINVANGEQLEEYWNSILGNRFLFIDMYIVGDTVADSESEGFISPYHPGNQPDITFTINEGVTLTIAEGNSFTLNDAYMNIFGTLEVQENASVWVNLFSQMQVFGTVNNYGHMFAGFYAFEGDEYAGQILIPESGTINNYGYLSVPSAEDGSNKGGFVGVGGTLNNTYSPDGWMGFTDVYGTLEVLSTAKVSTDALFAVADEGAMTAQAGADLSGVVTGGIAVTGGRELPGVPNEKLLARYTVEQGEQVKTFTQDAAQKGYGAVELILTADTTVEGDVTFGTDTVVQAAEEAVELTISGKVTAQKNMGLNQVDMTADSLEINGEFNVMVVEGENGEELPAKLTVTGDVTGKGQLVVGGPSAEWHANDNWKNYVDLKDMDLWTAEVVTNDEGRTYWALTQGEKQESVLDQFVDVAEDDWFADSVVYVVENGMMGGYGNGSFGPNDQLNRAMIAEILYKYEGKPDVGASDFNDVPNGEWYYNSVTWAQANGVVTGYSDGTYKPMANITREQLAVILYRYANNKGLDTSANKDLSSFPDAGNVSSWAQEAMEWAVGAGIINGKNGKLAPGGNATRAETATMLMRFFG